MERAAVGSVATVRRPLGRKAAGVDEDDRKDRTWLVWVAVLLFVLLTCSGVTWVMWEAPNLLTRGEYSSHAQRVAAANAARGPLATSLLAFGASLTAIFTASNYFLTRRNTRLEHRLAREGQVTDRYNDAVSHVGHEALHVRLGGVYALQRIGLDSARDRLTIISVLTAFIRNPPMATIEAWQGDYKDAPVSPDVQSALEALSALQRPGDGRLDLTGARLQHLDIAVLDLHGAVLRQANLRDVRGASSRLGGADLSEADLRGAKLSDADIAGARFDDAYLHDAELCGADARGSRLASARGLTVEQAASLRRDNSTSLPTVVTSALQQAQERN